MSEEHERRYIECSTAAFDREQYEKDRSHIRSGDIKPEPFKFPTDEKVDGSYISWWIAVVLIVGWIIYAIST
jgi:hypothetical protein